MPMNKIHVLFKSMINRIIVPILLFTILIGCNLGHPERTNKTVSEADFYATWTYRNEIRITLFEKGKGIQTIGEKKHPIGWKLTQDNHIELHSIQVSFTNEIKNQNFKFIISDDYRDHFYFFGGPDDFDNYEIWEKSK